MNAYSTDARLNAPLAADFVTDIAAFYDRRGGSVADPLDMDAELDELTILQPYTHRIGDVTRLIAGLFACLVPNTDDIAETIPTLAEYVRQSTRQKSLGGPAIALLFVAADLSDRTPLAIRDQFLIDPAEFSQLPAELAGPLFGTAVATLRVVTEYVHGCFRMPELSRGDVLRTLLDGSTSSD